MTDQPTLTYRIQEALKRPTDVIRIEEHHRLILEALLKLLNVERPLPSPGSLSYRRRLKQEALDDD